MVSLYRKALFFDFWRKAGPETTRFLVPQTSSRQEKRRGKRQGKELENERVAQQFERLDTQLGGNRTALPPNDEELKATLGALLARLERSTTVPRPSDGYGFTSRAAGARLDARSFGLGSMLGGRDATTAAAPISRPAGGI